jgi:ElaB/YqjD/DUF883 family membrane-anchored ribosome-binding protein
VTVRGMSRRRAAPWIAAVALSALLPALPSCETSGRGDGLVQVNDFMTMVERVHTDAELSAQKVHEASEQFSTILAFNFDEPPVAAYNRFGSAVDAETQQLKQFRSSIDSMKRTAEPVFKKWAADLETFDSFEMRTRSQNRLMETRKRYEAILAAAQPAEMAYTTFDKKMRDYATFLSHDFNEAAVAMLRADEGGVKEGAVALNGHFDACQLAAREYVQASAMPSAPVQPEPAAERAPAKKNGRSGG